MQLSTLLPLLPLFLSFSSALTIPFLHPRAAALGSLGGAAPPVTDSGDPKRPFEVNGNTFVNQAAAQQRSCDIQNNACFNAFNKGGASFTQADCTAQQQQCNSAAGSNSGAGSAGGAAGGNGTAGAGAGAGAASASATAPAAGAGTGSGTGAVSTAAAATSAAAVTTAAAAAGAGSTAGAATGTGADGADGTDDSCPPE